MKSVFGRRILMRFFFASSALAGAALAPQPLLAQSLPTGASVAYGNVGFQQSGNTLVINQRSSGAIVNYSSFSIGAGSTVTFNQPNANAVILNRVTGSTPSTIAGALNANGQVYLVNPNGIAITPGGVVSAGGGFVASSLAVTDEAFKQERMQFAGTGASAAVTNAGTITVARGGYAALIGGTVRNSGAIAAPLGKVALGSGEAATLDFSGDGFLQVALPTSAGVQGALVQNSGMIQAAGGVAVLTAATARAAARNAVNISGGIDAHSVSGRSGAIVIGGGDGGEVQVSGSLDVSGDAGAAAGSVTVTGDVVDVSGAVQASGRTGGSIAVTGQTSATISGGLDAVGDQGLGGTVAATGANLVLTGADIDASGATGGGGVFIGGDLHGAGPLADAETTSIDAATLIKADATAQGDGGSVVVWSNSATNFAGRISARGGPQGGEGGSAEVSSKGVLGFEGVADLSAPFGATGTLLLDPFTLTIDDVGSNPVSPEGSNPVGFVSSVDSDIAASTIDAALANANVVIQAGPAGGGSITVASNNLNWFTSNSLTLTASASININGTIYAPNGTLVLNAGGNVSQTAPIDVATLSGTTSGSIILNNDENAIATINGLSSGGDISVTTDTLLTIAGGIEARVGQVTLVAGGPITETVGPIVAATLTGSSVGDVDLAQPTNIIGELSDFTTSGGDFSLWSVGPLTFSGTQDLSGGRLYLDVAGPITQSAGGSIQASELTVAADGGLSLGSILNEVATVDSIYNQAAGDVVFDDGVDLTLTGDVTNSDSRGSTSLAAPRITIAATYGPVTIGSSATTTVTGPITLDNDLVLNGATVDVTNTIDGAHALSVNGAGELGGGIGGVTPLIDVDMQGGVVTLDGSVTTGGGQTYSGIRLGADVTLSSTGGGEINPGAIDGAFNLRIATTGDTVLSGAIGSVTPLASLTTSSNGPTMLSGGSIATTGAQTYEGPTSLMAAMTLTSSGGAITTNSTVDGAYSLTIAGTAVNLNDRIGGSTPVAGFKAIAADGDVTIGSIGSIAGNGPILIAANGDFINNNTAAGAAVLTPGSGSYFNIYTQDPTNPSSVLPSNTLGGVTATHYYNDAFDFTHGTFSSALPAGNHLVYGYTAVLTYTADPASAVYGSGLPSFTGAVTGFVNGDSQASATTGTLAFTTTAAATAGVGSYAINGSGLSSPNNYVFAQNASNASAFTVTPAPLTITADNVNKVYGASPTLTASYTGLVNNDTPASFTLAPTLTTAASAGSSVGTYGITASGAVDPNYTITYAPGMLTVTPAPLTITADNVGKVYGAAPPTLMATYTGLVNNDTPASLTIAPTLTTAASAGSSVGIYGITASGAVDPNYTITYAPGVLTVTPAPLTITADNVGKVYGAGLPTLTASYAGLVNNDTPASLAGVPTLTTAASAGSSVGVYGITASGAFDPNYTISYAPGMLTVTPAPLTITAANASKVFGAAPPALTASYAGLANNDTPASLAVAPTLTTTVSLGSPVGTYAITASGAVDPNYTITYEPGVLTVTPTPMLPPEELASLTGQSPWAFAPPGADRAPVLPATGNGQAAVPALPTDIGDPRYNQAVVCFQGVCIAQ